MKTSTHPHSPMPGFQPFDFVMKVETEEELHMLMKKAWWGKEATSASQMSRDLSKQMFDALDALRAAYGLAAVSFGRNGTVDTWGREQSSVTHGEWGNAGTLGGVTSNSPAEIWHNREYERLVDFFAQTQPAWVSTTTGALTATAIAANTLGAQYQTQQDSLQRQEQSRLARQGQQAPSLVNTLIEALNR